MKTKIKLWIAIMGLLLTSNLQAQGEYEDITHTFGSWINNNNDLTIHSNNLTLLSVEKTNIRDNSDNIIYGSMVKNLNLKTDFLISFKMDMRTNNDDVYWGIMFEFYTTDGSFIRDQTWYNKKGKDNCSINRNNTGWEKCHRKNEIGEIPFCPSIDDSYSISFKKSKIELDNYNITRQGQYVGLSAAIEYSHIAGIKSITIMVGSGARVSIKNFTVQSLNSKSVSTNFNQSTSNQQEQHSPDFYNKMGMLYSEQANHAKAIAYFSKTLELNPNDYWANNNIGYQYLLTEEYRLGIPYLQKAIEIEPDNPFAYSNMGGIYICMEKYSKAIEYCHKAINIKDKYNSNLHGRTPFPFGEPYYYIGLAYGGLNDWGQSLLYMKEAARLGDSNAQEVLKSGKIPNNLHQQDRPTQQKQRPAQGSLTKDPNFKIK